MYHAKSISELARGHVVAIRRLQSFGPYRIGGYQFGGLLALETAQQLQAQGQRVEILFLLDPLAPLTIDAKSDRIQLAEEKPRRRGATVIERIAHRPNYPQSGILRRSLDRLTFHPVLDWIVYHYNHLGPRKTNPVAREMLSARHWPTIWRVERRLAKRFTARPYDGKTIAYFAKRDERFQRWADVCESTSGFHLLTAAELDAFEQLNSESWMSTLTSAIEHLEGAWK